MVARSFHPRTAHLTYTNGAGGAGVAAGRLVRALRGAGAASDLFVRELQLDQQLDALAIETRPVVPFDRRAKELAMLGEQILWEGIRERTSASNTMFTLPMPSVDIESAGALADYGWLHLHWVSYMLDYRSLPALHKAGKLLAWTLHDQRPFTGGCHYSAGCRGFANACTGCPQLARAKNLPASVLANNLRLLEAVPLLVICPSRWMAREAADSKLFSNKTVVHIPNAVPASIFKPADKMAARAELARSRRDAPNINADDIVVCLASQDFTELRKGTRLVVKAIQILASRNPELVERVVILSAGNGSDALGDMLSPFVRTWPVGYLNTEQSIAVFYAAADLLVLPSLEDNLPNVLVEAAACGTPAVGFSVGGVREIISASRGGLLCDEVSPESLASALESVLRDPNRLKDLGEKARAFAELEYSPTAVAAQHFEAYGRHADAVGTRSSAPVERRLAVVPERKNFGVLLDDIYELGAEEESLPLVFPSISSGQYLSLAEPYAGSKIQLATSIGISHLITVDKTAADRFLFITMTPDGCPPLMAGVFSSEINMVVARMGARPVTICIPIPPLKLKSQDSEAVLVKARPAIEYGTLQGNLLMDFEARTVDEIDVSDTARHALDLICVGQFGDGFYEPEVFGGETVTWLGLKPIGQIHFGTPLRAGDVISVKVYVIHAGVVPKCRLQVGALRLVPIELLEFEKWSIVKFEIPDLGASTRHVELIGPGEPVLEPGTNRRLSVLVGPFLLHRSKEINDVISFGPLAEQLLSGRAPGPELSQSFWKTPKRKRQFHDGEYNLGGGFYWIEAAQPEIGLMSPYSWAGDGGAHIELYSNKAGQRLLNIDVRTVSEGQVLSLMLNGKSAVTSEPLVSGVEKIQSVSGIYDFRKGWNNLTVEATMAVYDAGGRALSFILDSILISDPQ